MVRGEPFRCTLARMPGKHPKPARKERPAKRRARASDVVKPQPHAPWSDSSERASYAVDVGLSITERTVVPPDARKLVDEMEKRGLVTKRTAQTARMMIDSAPSALGGAVEWVLMNLNEPGINVLSAVGKAISAGMRGAILREQMFLARWSLSHVSEWLEMGHPSAVLRAIRDLGLEPEYDAHKRETRVLRRSE